MARAGGSVGFGGWKEATVNLLELRGGKAESRPRPRLSPSGLWPCFLLPASCFCSLLDKTVF